MKNILDQYRKKPIKKEVLPFLSSIYEDMWILEEDVLGSMAHVIMLGEQKILTEHETQSILKELLSIFESIREGSFKINSEFEDIHPYIESLVINEIGMEIGGKIHSARSRNDQIALDIRLKIRKKLIELSSTLIEMLKVLLGIAKKSQTYFCPLYTHLQRGQLGCFSHFLLNYSSQLERVITKIFICFEDINQNPLGACAIGGTSFPINRKRTTELLGFNGEIFNSIDAVSSRDHLLFTIMILTILADIFTRIAEDFIIWSSKEFDFISIDDGYASVSSAMPQKKNPDTLELIKGRMGRIYGSLNQILFMSKGTPSGYVRDFQESKVPLKSAFKTMIEASKILTGIFETMTIKEKNLFIAADESLILALDLAEYIASNTVLSFREAHGLVGFLVTHHNKEELLDHELIEKASFTLFQKRIQIDNNKLIQFKNPKFALENRNSLGSPNEYNNNIAFADLEKNISNYQEEILKKHKIIENSENEILNIIKKMLKSGTDR